jgi:hypothetical protein
MQFLVDLKRAVRCRGEASKLSRLSGVSASVISRLVTGKIDNVEFRTVVKLQAGLKKLAAAKMPIARKKATQGASSKKEARS